MTTFYHLYDEKKDKYIRKDMNYTKIELSVMKKSKLFLEKKLGYKLEIYQSKDFLDYKTL
jgi:hypothetical protein